MRILIVGSGGREHAIAWKLSQEQIVDKIWVMPGNAGMEITPKVELIEQNLKEQDTALNQILERTPDLVVIGSEMPLSWGWSDILESHGLNVLGPSKMASQLESSKAFAKDFMYRYGIPTAQYQVFDDYQAALDYVKQFEHGVVVKADQLAAGKGVVVAQNQEQAREALFDFMQNPKCEIKAKRVVIEQKLAGKEVSAFALCDGNSFVPLGYVCDYKRAFDGNQGPNTGGMGGYTPQDWPSWQQKQFINDAIFAPVLAGMKEMGHPFKGILFAGLMIDQQDVRVIEFNVRLGDPETQLLLPLISNDLCSLFLAASKGELKTQMIKHDTRVGVHVVMASKGYPSICGEKMLLNQRIEIPEIGSDCHIFYSGVKKEDKQLVNSGGRVLGITALGPSIDDARKRVYQLINGIKLPGGHWREDIGY